MKMSECLRSADWDRQIDRLLRTAPEIPFSVLEKLDQAYLLGTDDGIAWLADKLTVIRARVYEGEPFSLEGFGPLNKNSLNVWLKDNFPGMYAYVMEK